MTIRLKDIQAINDDLKKRKLSDLTKNSEKPVSTKKAVMQLAPTLIQKKAQGFTTTDLVDLLNQHQIDIKPRDLSRYLREYKKTLNETQAKKEATNESKTKHVSNSKMPGVHEQAHDLGIEASPQLRQET